MTNSRRASGVFGAAVLLALSAASAQAAHHVSTAGANHTKFDLVCTGQQVAFSIEPSSKLKWEPWSATYHVNLATNEWCFGKCAEVRPILMVRSDEIALDTLTKVERRTGVLTVDVERAVVADCTPAPFTGFGKQLF